MTPALKKDADLALEQTTASHASLPIRPTTILKFINNSAPDYLYCRLGAETTQSDTFVSCAMGHECEEEATRHLW